MPQRTELSWTKAPPYRIEKRSSDAPRHVGAIVYGCSVFELVDDETAQAAVLVPNNTVPVPRTIKGFETEVLFDLANIQPTWGDDKRSDLERFADDYGLLFKMPEVDVSACYRAAASVWACLHLISIGRRDELVVAIRGKGIPAGRRRFGIDGQSVIEPCHLMDFCLLQLADLIEKRAEVRRCPRLGCGRFYEAKVGRNKWCSDTCKTGAHSAKKHLPMVESQRNWMAHLGDGGMYLNACLKRAWIDPAEWPLHWDGERVFDVRRSPVLLDAARHLTEVDRQNEDAKHQRTQYGLARILTDIAENATFTAIRQHATPLDLIAA